MVVVPGRQRALREYNEIQSNQISFFDGLKPFYTLSIFNAMLIDARRSYSPESNYFSFHTYT